MDECSWPSIWPLMSTPASVFLLVCTGYDDQQFGLDTYLKKLKDLSSNSVSENICPASCPLVIYIPTSSEVAALQLTLTSDLPPEGSKCAQISPQGWIKFHFIDRNMTHLGGMSGAFTWQLKHIPFSPVEEHKEANGCSNTQNRFDSWTNFSFPCFLLKGGTKTTNPSQFFPR